MRTAVLAALALAACTHAPPPKRAQAPAPAPAVPPPLSAFVRSPLFESPVHSHYTVILPKGADADAAHRAVAAAAKARGFIVQSFDEPPDKPRLVTLKIDKSDTAAMPADYLDWLGEGLSDADRAGILAADQMLLIAVFDPDNATDILRSGVAFAREVVTTTGGWIYDVNMQRIYSRGSFDAAWPDDFAIAAPRVLTIGYWRDDDGSMAMWTYGLERLGLPELAIRGVPPTYVEDMNMIVNAAAETILEGGGLGSGGTLAVDVGTLKGEDWPERAKSVRADGGAGRVTWRTRWVPVDDGDETRRLELLPPGTGDHVQGLMAVQAAWYGAGQEQITHRDAKDPELLAAAERARKDLAALQQRFADGIPVGERLVVKAPFATDTDTVEWMWVDVQTWRGSTLAGVLVNEPDSIAALKLGSRVEVKLDELADYIHYRADGTQAGGESVQILQRRRDDDGQ